MIKKVILYIFLFFCFILNIILDFNIKSYVKVLEECFSRDITLTNNLYVLICFIIALISILIILDILLVFFKTQEQNKGINFKMEDRHLWNSKLDE
jgi:hypothetical protein